ncbi:hypothetical protein [Kribbella voronezhensis]|uniref:hypothetical protein n=1 Tax=Kribbella voronezhensis TaxID=2512212 RepID=UPI001062BB98|nr:hypothetical protein [Kribbella voronezhensis]
MLWARVTANWVHDPCAGTFCGVQMKWLDANGNLLQADEVALPELTSTWQQATAQVTAPIGSTSVTAYLVGSGSPGELPVPRRHHDRPLVRAACDPRWAAR